MTPTAVYRRGATRSAVARWVLGIVLVVGVLGMHAVTGPHTSVPTEATISMPMSMAAPADTAASAPADEGHAPAGGHSMLSMCLAVLGSMAALVLLIALGTPWPASYAAPGSQSLRAVSRAGREPPWTVLSLHQLSLLRV